MSLYSTVMTGIGKWFLRSVENPAVPLTSKNLSDIFGSVESSSGMVVNPKTALTIAAVKSGIQLISNDVGKLPLETLKREGEQGKVQDRSHPLWSLLRYSPNSWMTSFGWHQVMLNHLLMMGQAFSFIRREGATPVELWPLSPTATVAHVRDGQLFYTTVVDGVEKALHPDEVLHFLGMTRDGIRGIPLIEIARESWGLALAMQRYSSKFFANDARPSTVIKHPGRLDDIGEKKLRTGFERIHKGIDSSFRTAVLEEGSELQIFGTNAEESQLIESRIFQNAEVARWLRLPPHKLGDPAPTSFSSLEQLDLDYLGSTIDPLLTMMEQEFRKKLLPEREKKSDSHVIKYNRKAIVRTDLKTQFEALRIGLGGAPFIMTDEAREVIDLSELPDGEGKVVPQPLNIGDPGGRPDPSEEGEGSRNKADQSRERARIRGRWLIEGGVERCFRRLETHVRRRSKSPEKFLDWLDEIVQLNEESVRSCLEKEIHSSSALNDDGRATLINGCVTLILDGLRSHLLEASGECRPSELESKSMDVFEEFKQECLQTIVTKVIGENHDS